MVAPVKTDRSWQDLAGSKILLVEDEFIVARDIQRRLELIGYVVLGCVSTGADAVARSAQLKPDLVLIDIALRGNMDGIETARRILDESDVAVVFATANSDLDTFNRARKVGPSGFVLKPFDEKEIGIVIEAALHKRAAERALRESEARYRGLFDNSTTGLLLISDVILDCNEAFCKFLDLPKGDVVGRTLAQLSPEEQFDRRPSTAAAGEHLEKALSGGGESLRWRFFGHAGTPHEAQLELRAVPYRGRAVVQAAVFPDLDGSKEGHTSRALAAIVESSDDAIFSKDLDGKILSWNAGAERIYGYTAGEVVGRSVSLLLPPERAGEITEMLRRLKAGERIDHFETERVRKDGRRINVSVTISPVRDSSGTVVAASTIARDITVRKAHEEQVKTSLREKEFLLRELRHRTKNNLQIISSLLNMQAEATGSEEFRSLIRQSQDRVKAMSLIQSRLQGTESVEQVEFGEYVRGLVFDLSRTYGSARISINVEADTVYLDVDTSLSCGLIINELVTNSFKHAFPDQRSGVIDVRFHGQGAEACSLSVADNGIGMRRQETGSAASNLGFRLVDTLVAQIGGRMETSTAAGTTVTIQFPR